ncbi:ribonuclease P, partial [Listeria monocytogenes]|nr:ribonuclease P [Listeria monocytogenes]
LYYFVQENGNNYRMNGTEENRQSLVEKVKIGRVRKVLVKQDIPITAQQSDDNLLNELTEAFNNLLPYYEVTKK